MLKPLLDAGGVLIGGNGPHDPFREREDRQLLLQPPEQKEKVRQSKIRQRW
jgi:hypothetical protein